LFNRGISRFNLRRVELEAASDECIQARLEGAIFRERRREAIARVAFQDTHGWTNGIFDGNQLCGKLKFVVR
jgi:hypothetical protein